MGSKRVRWAWLGATLALTAVLTASAAGTATRSRLTVHEYTYTLTVTGAVKESGTFHYSLYGLPACSVIAEGYLFSSPREFRLPAGGSTQFGLDWLIARGYTGPGTYSKAADFLGVALTARNESFVPGPGTTLSVTVYASGSGKATFTHLREPYTTPTVEGSEAWTCN